MKLLFEYQYPNVSVPLVGAWVLPHNICDDIIKNFENKRIAHEASDLTNTAFTKMTNFELEPNLSKMYSAKIALAFEKYIEKYNFVKHASEEWFISQPFYIERYDPKNFSPEWRCETLGPQKGQYMRHLAFMTYLNEIEDGGGDEFLHQQIYTNAKKGLTLIWPAGWTHMYKPRPTKEIKYVIKGWAVFKNRI